MSLTSKYWLLVCVFIVAVICLRIDESSNKKYYRGKEVKYEAGGPERFEFSVSICYPLNPDDNYCEREEKISKLDCNFTKQLSCYGKSTKGKTSKEEVKSFFKECNLHKLMNVRNTVTNQTDWQEDEGLEDFHEHHHHRHEGDHHNHDDQREEESKYEINEKDEICTTYTYSKIEFTGSLFRFIMNYEHQQMFRMFVKVKHMNDSHAHGHKRMVFARHCHQNNTNFATCFDFREAREYVLSIAKLNLYTNDKEYRRVCCWGSSCKERFCKGVENRLDHIETELNRSGIDCGECAIYCEDSWQYAFEIDR